MLSKAWDEITYPFPNFNGATVEVWEWISNFIPHLMMDELLIHSGFTLKYITKKAPGHSVSKMSTISVDTSVS